MLSRPNRLTESDSFRIAVRRGRRAGSKNLVVHLGAGPESDGPRPPRVGFVVSKAVGNAVARNRVKRQLRHLAREHLVSLPGSAVLVVRALPHAAQASAAELDDDLGRCLQRVV